MTRLQVYRVDAFADRPFAGNPAAVVPLQEWLPEATMQAIAAENRQPATVFFRAEGAEYAIRWFSPAVELPLCGHGTLASGFVILDLLKRAPDTVVFRTKSAARLEVSRDGTNLAMRLPTLPPAPCAEPPGLAAALGAQPRETLAASYYLAVFATADEVTSLQPDFAALRRLGRGTIVTAPGGDGFDFVSRMLAPASGIDEDAATGSAHCTLTPYWAACLGKTRLRARQASPRGATMTCTLAGDGVVLSAPAILFAEGTITI